MVQEHHMVVLPANHVRVLCIGLCISGESHIQYTYTIGPGAQPRGAPGPCKYFSFISGMHPRGRTPTTIILWAPSLCITCNHQMFNQSIIYVRKTKIKIWGRVVYHGYFAVHKETGIANMYWDLLINQTINVFNKSCLASISEHVFSLCQYIFSLNKVSNAIILFYI